MGRGLAMLLVAFSISLVLGFLTPLASSLTALTIIPSALYGLLAYKSSGVAFIVVIAVALLCLGPGAFSLDARRYGRHEIIIPQNTRPSPDI
jgi:uncharacterized membrane protein YphA (DoxX/SURF4 family)